jgi:hypothetical protein
MLFVGALLLPDTPNSLIERGKLEKGEAILQRIRGTKGGAASPACLRMCSHSLLQSLAVAVCRTVLIMSGNPQWGVQVAPQNANLLPDVFVWAFYFSCYGDCSCSCVSCFEGISSAGDGRVSCRLL